MCVFFCFSHKLNALGKYDHTTSQPTPTCHIAIDAWSMVPWLDSPIDVIALRTAPGAPSAVAHSHVCALCSVPSPVTSSRRRDREVDPYTARDKSGWTKYSVVLRVL